MSASSTPRPPMRSASWSTSRSARVRLDEVSRTASCTTDMFESSSSLEPVIDSWRAFPFQLKVIRAGASCLSVHSKLVGGPEAAPVAALHADRNVDLAHHHRKAVAHVARVALDQIRALVARGRQPRRIVEDAAVAAVGGIPGDIARPLRMGIDLVVHRQIAVA